MAVILEFQIFILIKPSGAFCPKNIYLLFFFKVRLAWGFNIRQVRTKERDTFISKNMVKLKLFMFDLFTAFC